MENYVIWRTDDKATLYQANNPGMIYSLFINRANIFNYWQFMWPLSILLTQCCFHHISWDLSTCSLFFPSIGTPHCQLFVAFLSIILSLSEYTHSSYHYSFIRIFMSILSSSKAYPSRMIWLKKVLSQGLLCYFWS